MHEVVSLSCSHASSHLLTHLYNVQETHIPYAKNAKLSHSNSVFLWPVKAGARCNYYPRSLNIELAGGYGYLGKYEFKDPKVDLAAFGSEVEVRKQDRVEKNDFQRLLDAGARPDGALLNTANTSYWTDYNKLVYRPASLLQLENYVHPMGNHKHFQKLLFKEYNVGEEEFALLFDAVDDSFRKNLEALDMIQGINFVSEVDNAWGGFTNEMMVQLKDEYFNNGANSKHNLWCYGLLAQKPNMLTRIKSIVEFSKNSSLFMPLSLPHQQTSLLSPEFDISSLWHRAAVYALFVNLIWGLNCQLELPVRMAEIEANLLRGFDRRNIVNEIRIEETEKQESPDQFGQKQESPDQFGLVADANIMDMYLGQGQNANEKQKYINLGISDEAKAIGRKATVAKLQDPESEGNHYVNPYIDEIVDVDTTPPIFSKSFSTTFGQNVSLKDTLKEYRKVIQRVRLPQHLQVIGDKAELVEDLSQLIDEYTLDYEDESDYE